MTAEDEGAGTVSGGDSEKHEETVESEVGTEIEVDGEKNGTGLLRLAGELTTFRAEFETLAEEAATAGEYPDWVSRGRRLLDKADSALEAGKIEQGWQYLHGAKRFRVFGLEALGGEEALRGEARNLIMEAKNAPLSWRAAAVREQLAMADGTLRDDLTVHDLRSAHQLLHEGYQRIHLKRQHLQSQFQYLRLCAVIAIVALLVIASIGPALGLLPSPFVEFSNGDSTELPENGSAASGNNSAPNSSDGGRLGASIGGLADSVGFLVYVVLFGVLGASLFGLRSLRRQPISGSTPQYLTGRQVAVARIVVGASSALIVFFFLRAEVLTIDVGAGVDQGAFLISMAFVAGYSERLAHTTVEAVASTTEADTADES